MKANERMQTIYFPHIPKCGGTTLNKYLKKTGQLVFFDYDHPPSYRNWYQKKCDQRNMEFKYLDFSAFNFVYGHYPLSRYNHENSVVLLLRHPIDRLISHFNFYKYLFSCDNKIGLAMDPLILEVKKGMRIIDFAKKANMKNFYKRYTNYTDTKNYKLVGFFSDMHSFYNKLEELCSFENKSISSAPKKRVNIIKDKITETELSSLNDLLKNEIFYFERQRKLWSNFK